MRQYLKQKTYVTALVSFAIISVFLFRCANEKIAYDEFSFNGATMGTTYHVVLVEPDITAMQRSNIASSIDSVLQSYNQVLSTFEDESEVSRFNRNQSIEHIPTSPMLLNIVKTSQDFCYNSDGAFDITVMPIVNFFGFGFEQGENRFPTVAEIDAWLQLTGCDKIEIGDSTLAKTDPRISIDLSAIAKGDASDHLVGYLMGTGYKNLFVEIGGEIMARGTNKYGKPWRIGIDRPNYDGAPGADLQHIIEVTDMGVASSGDYRNYREVEGIRISHSIDPRTGSPIDHNLAAVTVISTSCMVADGLSTSVMVMGIDEGLVWLENYVDAEGLLISREPDGSFKEFMTSGFKQYLID